MADLKSEKAGAAESPNQPLLPNPNPIFQLPGSPKQSDSSALDFEVSVLQCVKALVRLITGILQIVKTRCTGIQPHLQCIRIGLSHFVLELRDLLERRELLDGALQFQRLLGGLVLGCLCIALRLGGIRIRGRCAGVLRWIEEGKSENHANCRIVLLKTSRPEKVLVIVEGCE